ncbi:MAG: DUF2493 domain-containing protein [Sphingomonadales bacterium]|nr:DUF2493 domain-containing protein [Sphingomonadales bacterium]
MTRFTSFADLKEHYADATASDSFAAAFSEQIETSQLSAFDEPTQAPLPDDAFAEFLAGSLTGTPFELLADTRLEPFAEQIAWGIVNSLHMVARQIERREDDAAKKLGELARHYDPSEIYQTEMEDTQRICQSLAEAREAIEAMRDHAAARYRTDSGKPWSATTGSRSASGRTASQIDARDFLAARAAKKREAFAPEGPLVAISGGAEWEEAAPIYARLDSVKKRVPNMILVTTAQRKGVDAIAAAWAAANDVSVIAFRLDRSHGNRAAFARNERIISLQPVEVIACEGSGIQANLAQKARAAGVPLFVIRKADCRKAA